MQDLFQAIESQSIPDLEKAIQALGQEVPDWVNSKDDFDQKPLHLAANCGAVEVLKFCIEKANVDISSLLDDNHCTVLHLACLGSKECVELLLSHSPQLQEIADSNGALPIHWASQHGKTELVQLFSSTLNKVDSKGWTALHYAATNNRVDTVKWLLSNGVDKTIKDNRGKTAQQIAEEHDKVQIIEIFQDHQKD